jgi:hypothetical protein
MATLLPTPGLPPGSVITEALNPVTRSVIKLNPPFIPESEGDWARFDHYLKAYCQAAWMLGRNDPRQIDAPFGWVHTDPETPLAADA